MTYWYKGPYDYRWTEISAVEFKLYHKFSLNNRYYTSDVQVAESEDGGKTMKVYRV
jgi:hypothetical protein